MHGASRDCGASCHFFRPQRFVIFCISYVQRFRRLMESFRMSNRSKVKSFRKIQYGLISSAAILAAGHMVKADVYNWTGADAVNPTVWDLAATNWDNTTATATTVAWANNATRSTPNSATFSLATPATIALN